MPRRTRLVDCNPRWTESHVTAAVSYITFDCPEGHAGCRHTIPFTPALDGTVMTRPGAIWERKGLTFETLTLSPSIKRHPRYESREAAIAAGCLPEYITASMLCALHVVLTDGTFEFCADSK